MAENQPPRQPNSNNQSGEGASFEERIKKYREEQLGSQGEASSTPSPAPPQEPAPQPKPEPQQQTSSPSRPAQDLQSNPESLYSPKHEDVQTMEKEMRRIREQQAQKERNRVMQQKQWAPDKERAPFPQAKQQPPSQNQAQSQQKASTPPPLRRTPPKKPSRAKQTLIRALIFVIFLGLLISGGFFAYTYFADRAPEEQTNGEQPQNQTPPAEEEPEEEEPEEEPTPPQEEEPPAEEPEPSFVPLQRTVTILFTGDTLESLLRRTLSRSYPAGFSQIILRNEQENRTMNTQETLSALQIAAPQEITSQLQNGSLFFLHYYAEEERKRFGLFLPLREGSDITQTLTNWESSLEQDTAFLTSLVGGRGQGYTSQFRTHEYNGVQVRYQTLSRNDIGICYAVVDNTLILTTSLGGMEKSIDALQQ